MEWVLDSRLNGYPVTINGLHFEVGETTIELEPEFQSYSELVQ